MITLIVGKKGSGKTKKLIEAAEQAVKTSNGNVIVIEKGNKLIYDIPHDVRLIDTDSYAIQGAAALFGFVSGICAANYDVTDIFVDSTLKIIDMKDLQKFAEQMNTLSDQANTKITLLISADDKDLPDGMNAVCTKI